MGSTQSVSGITPRNSRWLKYDYMTPSQFSHAPAVYVVYLDGVLTYIGQASDLSKRIANHRWTLGYTDCFQTVWGRAHAITVKVRYSEKLGDWAMREIRLIARLNPPMNSIFTTKRKGPAR